MIATTYEQTRVFDSSMQPIQLQIQPMHQKPVLLEQPTIETHDEESSNPVLKQVLHDLRDAQLRFGSSHQKCADAWNALGLIRVHMQCDAEAARRCHEYALKIFRQQQLAKETATTLNDLGYCFERLNLPEIALNNYQECLRILESENFPENHPQLLSTRRAVSRMQRR
mmetsp:Transcript_24585/g.67859  ORF Transcript_24585/g.67859 Transcript_24585/m.67859 type:complete len:169 (-) Transcript_24585:1535-2041(-)|eukprot:CAMPEP_0172364930 /NCGR_PEP_ID=MMETSP1060-20121228/7951_1 /TAXON_ID=37318 /ORGANISM="Pseudo-nitzschia pungens, Strain cf. cingulata" /LENGTH=168 /DNA_ID=CAMNT_0013088061 /DNA_START=42 /DNA_END=548 /DNA_ORIENTATION=+